jgi:hypothetical protein
MTGAARTFLPHPPKPTLSELQRACRVAVQARGPVEDWGFAPPGSEDAALLGMPGAGGNHAGASLLDMSAICRRGIPTRRQTDHGIQSGCE